jgi:hypothetical protein
MKSIKKMKVEINKAREDGLSVEDIVSKIGIKEICQVAIKDQEFLRYLLSRGDSIELQLAIVNAYKELHP